jgi:PEP-CTERM motif
MTIRSTILTAMAAAILWPVAMHATTLYNSGTNSQTPPQGGISIGGPGVDANSFTLSSAASVDSVSFDILECCFFEWNGTINYYLFTNNSFEPSSTPFAQGTATSYIRTSIYDDSATNEVVEIDFNLTTPVALSANTTYWLGLSLSDSAADPEWNAVVPLSGISASTGSGNFNNWGLTAEKGAFALFNTTFQTTPEPGSAWMLLGGFGLIGLAYRLRSRALRYRVGDAGRSAHH